MLVGPPHRYFESTRKRRINLAQFFRYSFDDPWSVDLEALDRFQDVRHEAKYRLWFSAEGHRGWDALFVVEDRAVERSERYMPLFQEMDPEPVNIELFRKGQIAHALSVFRYYGFKGKYEEK